LEAEVLHSELPVVMDFYAPWCGPCRVLTPALERLAVEFAGQIKFVKVNVDHFPELAAEFGVTGVPTLVLAKDGVFVDEFVGLMPLALLRHKFQHLVELVPAVER